MSEARAPIDGPVRGAGPDSAAPRVVVVGSGIAGMTAALRAHRGGARVALIAKGGLDDTNTALAQGGIAGVVFDDDRTDDHLHDTLVAGAGLSDPAAVRVLVDEAAEGIAELVDAGVAFDRDAAGAFVKGLEAAHSYPRILHAGGDATGLAIQRALSQRVIASGIEVLERTFLVDVVRAGDDAAAYAGDGCAGRVPEAGRAGGDAGARAGSRIRGVIVLRDDATRQELPADAVVLATGGAGQLYAHTTNPAVATADGVAVALRAGAAVADLEFVQFHPTVLAAGEPFLVSEAVRGEGATLIDDDGRRFAFDAHPDGELAPRDVVARAIATRMAQQGGRPVRLDATRLGPTPEACAAFLATRFPSIDRAVRERGLDWAREPIPVTPAAHYAMGGVATDLDGRTSIPGLYAVGEVARTGVHGANRLASNSLLEGAVFGARAGAAVLADVAASAEAAPVALAGVGPSGPRRADAHPGSPGAGAAPRVLASLAAAEPFSRAALQRVMWDDVGLARDATGLERALAATDAWRAERAESPAVAGPFGSAGEGGQTAIDAVSRIRDLEDDNLLLVAAHVVRAALARRESAGAHHRTDAALALTVGAA